MDLLCWKQARSACIVSRSLPTSAGRRQISVMQLQFKNNRIVRNNKYLAFLYRGRENIGVLAEFGRWAGTKNRPSKSSHGKKTGFFTLKSPFRLFSEKAGGGSAEVRSRTDIRNREPRGLLVLVGWVNGNNDVARTWYLV